MTHRHVIVSEDNKAEMLCECGKTAKSEYKGARLVVEVVEVKSSDGIVLYAKDEGEVK